MSKEVMVEKMSVENGSIDMTLSGEPAKNFMTTLVQFFLQSGAENYITIEMQDNDGHKYGITVQDCNKEETPTAKLNRQQQQIEAYQQEIDRLKSIVTDIIAEIDAIEMSDDTGISEGLYAAMREAIELDAAVDSPGEVRQRLKADLYDKLVQIKALVADKDEQASRIMQLEELLKQAKSLMRNTERYLNSVMEVALLLTNIDVILGSGAIDALINPVCNTTKLECCRCNPGDCEHRMEPRREKQE